MFIHQKENTINLNNQARFTVQQFRALEPNYPSLPAGYTERFYEQGKTHRITGPGRTVINEGSVWVDGDRYFDRIEDFRRFYQIVEMEEKRIKEKVQNELNKRKPHDVLRKNEYPSIEQLVVAMWEHLIEKENKTDSNVSELQKLRKEIKEKYPKAEE